MQQLIIDTNVIIRYLKGQEGILNDILDADYELFITPVVITELFTSNRSSDTAKSEQINNFLQEKFKVVEINTAMAYKAGELLRSLDITLASAYQAAAALSKDIPLLSYDVKTFDQVPDLQLIDLS